MVLYVLLLLYTINLVVSCDFTYTEIVQQHGRAELSFKLDEINDVDDLYEIQKPDLNILFLGLPGQFKLSTRWISNLNRINVTVNSITLFSFQLDDVTSQDAGVYCCTSGAIIVPNCGVKLIVTDKPSIRLSLPREQLEAGTLLLEITCNATSTTKPTDHNLPMIYRWFKHGIYYDNGRILQDRDVDITDLGDDTICIATDDPDCKSTLKELTVGSRLNTVIGDTRCKAILGLSNNFILLPEYGPYNTTLMYGDRNLKPGEEIKKRIGEELSVNCRSDCSPVCNIRWYKDGKMLSSNQQLNLSDLQESDDGVYTCIVYNMDDSSNISFILQLEALTYPDCCPPAVNSMSSDDVTLVDVGEKIILLREITGHPRPSIEVESMILPVGINNHPRYINYTLINTTKPNHYNLRLSVYVVTKHYLATNDVINTTTEIIITCLFGSCLLIAVLIVGLVFVKRCFNSMAPNTRTIPLEHHYDHVAMRQLSTDLTTVDRPTNRTLLRDRESLITSSTQVSSDYARPDSLIVHRLPPDYHQQGNLTDGVEEDGDNEDLGDVDLNDANSASLCMNSPTAVPNVYERLNKYTRIKQPNLYKKLKW